MGIFRIKRRIRALLVLGSTVSITGIAVLTIVGSGTNASTKPLGVSAQATSQVSWLCTRAGQQVHAGTASGFMQSISKKCDTEGAVGLAATADNKTAPLGALICQYAAARVQAGTASPMDKSQDHLCNLKPLPPESGILSQPSAPPSGSGITVTNGWAGTLNGQRELVYAGAQSDYLNNGDHGNPRQGVILVVDVDTNMYHTYASSALDGALTIARVTGTAMSLTLSVRLT